MSGWPRVGDNMVRLNADYVWSILYFTYRGS
jgi:hypothetical protein